MDLKTWERWEKKEKMPWGGGGGGECEWAQFSYLPNWLWGGGEEGTKASIDDEVQLIFILRMEKKFHNIMKDKLPPW